MVAVRTDDVGATTALRIKGPEILCDNKCPKIMQLHFRAHLHRI